MSLRTPLLIICIVTMSVTALAGCLDGTDLPSDPNGTTDPSTPRADRLAADLATLPCEPHYEAGSTSPVFKEIFHMETEEVRYGEIDAIDGSSLVVFARYGGGGFDILNVSNPYEPEHVVAFPIEESYSLDIKVSSDGKTLYSGGFGAITIVDISDPYAPETTRTITYPEPYKTGMAQAHMLHVANISGTDYVFAATQWGYGVLIYKAVGEPGATDLEYVTVFAPAVGGPLAAHDMMVYHDPVAEKPILWVANGFGGFIAADVSDPALPVVVSYSPEADPYQGYTHTVSVTHYGEKRYAVTMAELGAMALKVHDVTNMAAPILVATWTIEDVPTSTQHNTQILGEWLWLGHYGNGVVLFNLKGELAKMTLPAYNLGVVPVVDSLDPFAQYLPESGSTWESVVVNGVHWTTSGGIYGTLNGCFEAGNVTVAAYV